MGPKKYRGRKAHAEGISPTPAKVEPHPLAYCVEDVAKVLGIGRTFVFFLIRDRQLAAVKIGRRTVVTVKECEAFLARIGGAA